MSMENENTNGTNNISSVKQADHIERLTIEKLNPKQKKILNFIKRNVWVFPLFNGILVIVVCFLPYILSFKSTEITTPLPFVSDSGAILPGAGYFALFMTLEGTFIFVAIWCRYKQVKYYIVHVLPTSILNVDKEKGKELMSILQELQRKNFRTVMLSVPIALANIFIGCYRSTENIGLHSLGALVLAICIGYFKYLFISICNILYKYGRIESRPISLTIVFILYCISYTCIVIFSTVFAIKYASKDAMFENSYRLKIDSSVDGYQWYLASTGSEWLTILLIMPTLLMLSKRMAQFNKWHEINF